MSTKPFASLQRFRGQRDSIDAIQRDIGRFGVSGRKWRIARGACAIIIEIDNLVLIFVHEQIGPFIAAFHVQNAFLLLRVVHG